MKVACIKEIKDQEFRVGLAPVNVHDYVARGHEVLVESGAGEAINFTDADYKEAGAKIVSTKEAWEAEMIIKVKEPLESEFSYFKENQILFTYLHLANEKALTEALLAKKVSAVALETIKVGNFLPCLAPMSAIAGRLSITQGAKYLEKTFGGNGTLLGGVPSVPKGKVLILGGGVVGLNAAQMAMGMGAEVTIMDIDMQRLAYFDQIFGSRINTLYSNTGNIIAAIKECDVLIGSVLIPGAKAPKLVKREYLKMMKKGSVIVDVAIDQGGCVESSHPTTHTDPIYIIDGVVHYSVANMPGAVAKTSSVALTNATTPYGVQLASKGLVAACKENAALLEGLNTHAGKITYKAVAEAFGMTYHEAASVL